MTTAQQSLATDGLPSLSAQRHYEQKLSPVCLTNSSTNYSEISKYMTLDPLTQDRFDQKITARMHNARK